MAEKLGKAAQQITTKGPGVHGSQPYGITLLAATLGNLKRLDPEPGALVPPMNKFGVAWCVLTFGHLHLHSAVEADTFAFSG